MEIIVKGYLDQKAVCIWINYSDKIKEPKSVIAR